VIEVKVSGSGGHRLEFKTDSPDDAVRQVTLFIRKYYPEAYKRLVGCRSSS